MKPLGHVFYVFSDVGQRSLWSPLDLADRHRNQAVEKTNRRIPQDQVRNSPYNRPGIIKAVYDGFVYFTVAEKIQDSTRRPALASHTMVFSLAELMEDGGSLFPPTSKEAYQMLGPPSELHSQGRSLADIQGTIDQYMANSEIQTTPVSPGWNSSELNWLLGNPRSIISVQGDDFSSEAAISEMLGGIPSLASAGLSFAAWYVPTGGGFHIAAYSGRAHSTSSRGVSAFTSRSSFKAAVESSPTEEVMETDLEEEFHLALTVTGGDPLDVLAAFRNGIDDEGNTRETIVANLIAQALSADGHPQRTLDALEKNIGGMKQLPRGGKEIILRALRPLTSDSNPARGQSEKLMSALSPSVSAPAKEDKDRDLPKVQAESSSPDIAQGDIDDVRAALKELKTIIDNDLRSGQDSEVGVEAVSGGVRNFTGLVIAGGPGLLQSEKLPGLVQGLWQEIIGWVKRGGREGNGRERPRLIRETFGYRQDPSAPSLFDDLMYITWQTRHLREHAKKVDLYNKLMDRAFGQDRPFWR